uniref:Transmembrane protein n=1 Tax=Heterorhabditis bacteriophora TaxID=37862 RepID=A0A1I7XTH9_HETBA
MATLDHENDGVICFFLVSTTFILVVITYFVTQYATEIAKKRYAEYQRTQQFYRYEVQDDESSH